MDLEKNKAVLDKCFAAYEDIQVKHLNSMTNEVLPDLGEMNQERATVFNTLKVHLDSFVGNAGSMGKSISISILSEFEKRLQTIMLIDDELAQKIQIHRDRLKSSLQYMKKGKTAMEGYKQANSIARKPFVFSINK